MTKFRLWRLRRAYRSVASLESRLVASREAAELRAGFAQQTVDMIDGAWKRQGVPRAERKARRRQIVKSA